MKKIIYIIMSMVLLASCSTMKKLAEPSNTSAYRKPIRELRVSGGRVSVDNGTSSSSEVSMSELARAGRKLGFDVELSDNRRLMTEAATWIGVPYRSGGMDRSGVDCSGLVYCLYGSVYGQRFERCSSYDMFHKYCTPVNASQLKQGDLVFFTTDNSGGRIGHSGIYLKNGKFIHASSSKGVIISNLNEQYWSKHWFAGGKVR